MRWSDRLNLAQRIVVIIGLGLALAVAADYLTSLVTEAGWYAYSPLTRPVISQSATGEPGWLRMIIWLAAKPVIDIDLTVADPDREQDYVPALETIGFRLVIREPWWYRHRALVSDEPRCNLHVFGYESPEPVRHRIFRDWLRGNPDDRDRYAAAKRQAAAEANAGGEHVMQYNARKQQVIRDIYHRAFIATGLLGQ